MAGIDINAPVAFKRGTYRFNDDANFNFQLNRVVFWDGGDADELMEIGPSIRTSEDWVGAMKGLAARAKADGRLAEQAAYTRMSEFFMYDSDPAKQETYREAVALFDRAYSGYFDGGRVRRFSVPYKGGSLPVMYAKAVGERRDTLLLHGGNDSYYEEFFFPMLYLSGLGFDVYLFEGPGQGGVLRVQNMKFEYEWENPVRAVLDFFKLDDVTIVGASLGGYLAPRAAAFEKRIRRVIAWSIFPDFFHVVLSDHPGKVSAFIEKILSSPIKGIMNGFYKKMMGQNELVRWNLLHGMYAYGAETPMQYIDRIRKFTLHGIADRIEQDVLVIGAREDHFIHPRLFHEEYDLLCNARSLTLRLFSNAQDAGAHCNVGNARLVLDAMAGWIAQVKE